jgi:hypothetical protein
LSLSKPGRVEALLDDGFLSSVLKNGRARAVRFSTLTAICEALDCEVGEVLYVDRTA